jgi:hypothetical protein
MARTYPRRLFMVTFSFHPWYPCGPLSRCAFRITLLPPTVSFPSDFQSPLVVIHASSPSCSISHRPCEPRCCALGSRGQVWFSAGYVRVFVSTTPALAHRSVIIGGLLVGTVWLWALASIKFGADEYVGSRRGKDYTHYEPRQSHKRSRGYDRGEDRSRKRSKGNVNWWERMTKA